jgi:hypothetical protein
LAYLVFLVYFYYIYLHYRLAAVGKIEKGYRPCQLSAKRSGGCYHPPYGVADVWRTLTAKDQILSLI